jgi:tetratricopeptide (TPR) repeat protein
MKRIALTFAVHLGLFAVLVSCDKDKTTTAPDGDVASTAGEGGEQKPDLPDVPQEPDPPQIAQGAHQYMMGNYKETVDLLAPVYADLKQRNQYRASGLAGGWLALAHAQAVVEEAEEPSQHALLMAEHTGDAEVTAVAKLAHGAYLMGQEDFAAASTAFEAAANAAPNSLPGALANLLRAESLIGRAFGGGESESVQDPAALETAKAAYAAAEKTAKAGTETDIIMGRVEEGLAAVARYQNDKAGICQHSKASLEHFAKAGASDTLKEGAKQLAVDFKCELPK